MRHMGITAGMVAALLLGLLAPALAQQIPALAVLPPNLVASNPDLAGRQTALVQQRATLHGKVASLNARCASVEEGSAAEVSCQHDQAELSAALNSHIQESKDFNADVEAAIVASTSAAQPVPAVDSESARVIKGINALAIRLGWSADKLARIEAALNQLGFDGDPNVTGGQIRRTWQEITARNWDADLVREAAQGGDLGFPGAGNQTAHKDCAIFALANATGLPYGVVAARATKLISEGEWHSASDRANPEAVIEQHGLNGGEVVMLAEVFGQAEVVHSEDFAKTLNAGRPVMVNVVPENGNVNSGHEVVLTKTFRHGGETWFVMMDSKQSPVRRLFLSSQELNALIQENGVAYRPESGTTPKLLRDSRTP
jgi:hypothetical protein